MPKNKNFIGIDPLTTAVGLGLSAAGGIGQGLNTLARDNYSNLNPAVSNALFTGIDDDQALQAVNPAIDYSDVKNNANLMNAWDANNLQETVDSPTGLELYGDYVGNNLKTLANLDLVGFAKNQVSGFKNLFGLNDAAEKYNDAVDRANQQMINNFYTTAQNNQARQQRRAMMNYYADGGDLGNGVTTFNTGGSHEQNELGGIQQGIASDNIPNRVEEGEVKFNDYIYSKRLKPSKRLLKDNNLPEKYYGLSYADLAKKLQKESEDRPNDPISINTLNEWMSRLANAQETHKANLEEKRLAKELDSMPTEDKAALMQSLMQQQEMAQQEVPQDAMQGMHLGQPMYAKGGSIHINPANKGKFNATKERTGKTTEELTHSKNPLTRKRAIFAQNASKWSHKGTYGLPLNIGNVAFKQDPNYSLGVTFNSAKTPTPIMSNLDLAKYIGSFGIKSPIDDIADIDYDQGLADIYSTIYSTEHAQGHKGINAENLRYVPAVGAEVAALQSAFQPVDYSYPNELRSIASRINPIAAPTLGDYRQYTPYNVNLADAETMAQQAAAIRANRGQNRATQGALNIGTTNAYQKANAARNLAAQQANAANRLAVDEYNAKIDQANANLIQQYDNYNTSRLNSRLGIEQNAATAADAARTGWSTMYNATHQNAFNQLGNVGRDTWNKNQRDFLIEQLGREGLLELVKVGYFNPNNR